MDLHGSPQTFAWATSPEVGSVSSHMEALPVTFLRGIWVPRMFGCVCVRGTPLFGLVEKGKPKQNHHFGGHPILRQA